MFCKKCGMEIADTAQFCHNCGAKVDPLQTTAAGPSKLVIALRAAAIWLVTAFAVAFAGAVLSNGKANGFMYHLAILIISVFPAVKLAVPRKYRAQNTAGSQPAASHPTPAPVRTDPPTPEPDYVERTYRVAGISYREENVLNLATENEAYSATKREIIDSGLVDQMIWKYSFSPCKLELVPEPDNPADPNAIKVIVDGQHIGYIKAGSCAHMHNLIREGRIRGMTCKIGGGPYKTVVEDYDDEDGEETYNMEKGTNNFSAVLTVREAK